MVLYLVEGLNCSGKTTYIERCLIDKAKKGVYYKTDWLNPLRDKFHPCNNASLKEIEMFMRGAYLTVLHSLFRIKNLEECNVYWDRTFISAFAYGTIEFDLVTELVTAIKDNGWDVRIVFLDIPVDVCMDRFMMREENRDYVAYVTQQTKLRLFWEKVSFKLRHSIVKLPLITYNMEHK